MRLLLDTNALLWLLNDDIRLTKATRLIITHAQEIAVSEVSLWEIAIKISIGKLGPIPGIYEIITLLGFERLQMSDACLERYISLPMIHRDPFDRMLIAQAAEHGLTAVTSDTVFKDYGIKVHVA